jgi:hypothetical protein
MMKVSFRISRWQRQSSEEAAQDLAREIELYEAPQIAIWRARVKANELRRQNLARLTAAAHFNETPALLRRQAI